MNFWRSERFVAQKVQWRARVALPGSPPRLTPVHALNRHHPLTNDQLTPVHALNRHGGALEMTYIRRPLPQVLGPQGYPDELIPIHENAHCLWPWCCISSSVWY